MSPRSPTEARALLLAWWLDVAERPCGHDPLDVREEREGIVCSDCGRLYRRRAPSAAGRVTFSDAPTGAEGGQ